MKLFPKIVALTLTLILSLVTATGGEKVRVACVGNSITYGMLIDDRETMCYPAQLGRMLGKGYTVENFGHSGATLLNRGHRPYMKLPEFRAALDFRPDIAVIHLGVNDTDPRDWPQYGDDFVKDYVALVDSFRSVNPDVRIIIANLTPISAKHRRYKSGTRVWRDIVRDKIVDVASATGSELIDFGTVLRDRQNLMPDGIHPNAEGAKILAETVNKAITGDYGGLSLPQVYGDRMVLQRYKPLKIKGTANAGAKVTVCIGDNCASTVTDGQGQWSVSMPPMSEAVGVTMTVTDGIDSLKFSDIAIGEVWLASGQSNMEFRLRHSLSFETDTLKANDPLLRLYDMKTRVVTNKRAWSDADKDSVDRLVYCLPTKWQKSTPANAAKFSAVAWHFGKMLRDSLDVPVGIIANPVGGTGIEAWIDIETLEHNIPEILLDWRKNDYIQPWAQERAGVNLGNDNKNRRHPNEPSYLFATSIRPLGAYPLAGVIWYQGESNAHNTELYEELFPLLLESWKTNWEEPEMPFIITQLSSFDNPSWALFRDSQRRLLKTHGLTGMAVTSDLGDSLDVHPRDKKPVGERLGRWALNRVYSMENVTPSGPLPLHAIVTTPGTVELTMEFGKGMHSSDGGMIRTFELAETDGLYYPAEAEVIEDNHIRLSNKDIENPRFVRYGWQPFTRANLVNSDNLPASTFKIEITEDTNIEDGIDAGVSAAFAGIADGHILKAGGCNFPVNPMATDSKKKFYQAIYEIIPDDTGNLKFEKTGMLPLAMAYGASVSTPDGLAIIGGTTAEKSLSTAYIINVDNDNKAEVTSLPTLPVSIDNTVATWLDGKIYVAGGNVDGVPSNVLFCLDMKNLAKGWKRLADFPGNPRVQPVMAASVNAKGQPRLYLWGGFAGKGDKRNASLETDGLEYNPANGKWRRIDGPKTESGEEISTAGGTASTLPDGRIILTGGVHKDIFLAALSNQAPDYLSHPIEWYRFNSRVLVFDPTTEKWNLMTEDKDTARAGANAIVLPDGTIMLVGGELKPRVRTPRISILRP